MDEDGGVQTDRRTDGRTYSHRDTSKYTLFMHAHAPGRTRNSFAMHVAAQHTRITRTHMHTHTHTRMHIRKYAYACVQTQCTIKGVCVNCASCVRLCTSHTHPHTYIQHRQTHRQTDRQTHTHTHKTHNLYSYPIHYLTTHLGQASTTCLYSSTLDTYITHVYITGDI